MIRIDSCYVGYERRESRSTAHKATDSQKNEETFPHMLEIEIAKLLVDKNK